MKSIINSLKKINHSCLKIGFVFITYLLFLIFPSCQKYKDDLHTQEPLKESTSILAPGLLRNPSIGEISNLYYGHKSFKRFSGAPFVETQKIENPNLDYFDGNFVLYIQNGSDKKTRVSSAEIKIDSILIAGPSDFSNNISFITKQLSGLTPESILEVKLNGAPGSFIDLWINGALLDGVISDIDGNFYKTVKIGNQLWMAENLKTTKYNNGSTIPDVIDNTAWATLTAGAYCDYGNIVSNSATYGRLYNWYVVAPTNLKNVCPTGWHVPSDGEWTTLTTYLGGDLVAGNKLKETGTAHWASPNTGATNETGFTALPGGHRNSDGSFGNTTGTIGFWWSFTEYDASTALVRYLSFDNGFVSKDNYYKNVGFSVRCLRDN
jgi:uncharacterized protein (TIGR02145 family)